MKTKEAEVVDYDTTKGENDHDPYPDRDERKRLAPFACVPGQFADSPHPRVGGIIPGPYVRFPHFTISADPVPIRLASKEHSQGPAFSITDVLAILASISARHDSA